MRSIPIALTWEMLCKGRWLLPLMALVASVMPLTILGLLKANGAIDPGEPHYITFHMTLFQIGAVVFSVAIFGSQPRPATLYTLPIRNSTLVVWLLLPSALTVALHSYLSGKIINTVYQFDWPLVGPALLAAVAVATLQAVLIFTEKSLWVVIAIGVIGLVQGIWFKTRYGELAGPATRMWSEVSLWDAGFLMAMAGGAFAMGCTGVARNRRGEPPLSIGVVDWIDRLFEAPPALGKPFQNPLAAQNWHDWTHRGWILPAVCWIGIIGGGLLWLIVSRDINRLAEGVTGGGLMLLPGALVAAMALGNLGANESRYDMRTFLATRPLTNIQLVNSLLRTAAWSTLIAWGLWLATLGLVWACVMVFDMHGVEWILWREYSVWLVPGLLLLPWVILTNGATACVADRVTTCVQGILVLVAVYVIVSIGCAQMFSTEMAARISQFGVGVAGVVFSLGTIGAFVVALRRSCITPSTAYGALGAWLLLITWALVSRRGDPLPNLGSAIFVVGLTALVVAPFAAMPLAIASNRTR